MWKTEVANKADARLIANFAGTPPPAYVGQVTVKVFYFPSDTMYADVDNGVKHTIDALSVPSKKLTPVPPHARILANDKTVMRVIAERFMPTPGAALTVPIGIAPSLAAAMLVANGIGAGGVPAPPQYATAIKMEGYLQNNGAFW